MSKAEDCRKAASIISELLVATLTKAEEDRRHLYVWEREAIEWLRHQWAVDPETQINMWTANRYVSNKELDFYAKLPPPRS